MAKVRKSQLEEKALHDFLHYLFRDPKNPPKKFITVYEAENGEIKAAASSSVVDVDKHIPDCKRKLGRYAIRTDEKIEGGLATITLSPIRYK